MAIKKENSTLQRITSNLERRRGDSNEVVPFSAIFVDIPDAICATESKTRRILCSWRAARGPLSTVDICAKHPSGRSGNGVSKNDHLYCAWIGTHGWLTLELRGPASCLSLLLHVSVRHTDAFSNSARLVRVSCPECVLRMRRRSGRLAQLPSHPCLLE